MHVHFYFCRFNKYLTTNLIQYFIYVILVSKKLNSSVYALYFLCCLYLPKMYRFVFFQSESLSPNHTPTPLLAIISECHHGVWMTIGQIEAMAGLAWANNTISAVVFCRESYIWR